MRFKKYITELLPYNGVHIPHTSSLELIKKAYGNTYKVEQVNDTWVVFALKAGQWIPVTTPFADKATANKTMAWLKSTEKFQKDKIDTIGKDDSGKSLGYGPLQEGIAEYHEAEYYDKMGGHSGIGNWPDFKTAYNKAMELYKREKKNDFEDIGYIGVSGNSDQFAIMYVDEDYLNLTTNASFQDPKAYKNWMKAATKVLKSKKPATGTY